jgi:selenocysteine lyase/cysteine desulfurase
VNQELARRGVHVDHRPGVGLRLGPHFYNTEDDVDRALAAIDEIVAGRGAARQAGEPTPCPE